MSQNHRHPSLPTDGVLLYGVHAVRAALTNPKRQCLRIVMTQNALHDWQRSEDDALVSTLHKVSPHIESRQQIDKIVSACGELGGGDGRSVVHQGVLAVMTPLPDVSVDDALERVAAKGRSACLVLDQLVDPHNIGAVMRSFVALGWHDMPIFVHRRHAPSLTPAMAKIACGAAEFAPLVPVPNIAEVLNALHASGVKTIGLDERGETSIRDFTQMRSAPQKWALVLGAEGKGLRQKTAETCQNLVKLPTVAPIQSLNASVAAGMALYELSA